MKQNELKQPFFAALLEAQTKTPEQGEHFYPTTKISDHAQTQKYPSDGDDDPIGVPF